MLSEREEGGSCKRIEASNEMDGRIGRLRSHHTIANWASLKHV